MCSCAAALGEDVFEIQVLDSSATQPSPATFAPASRSLYCIALHSLLDAGTSCSLVSSTYPSPAIIAPASRSPPHYPLAVLALHPPTSGTTYEQLNRAVNAPTHSLVQTRVSWAKAKLLGSLKTLSSKCSSRRCVCASSQRTRKRGRIF